MTEEPQSEHDEETKAEADRKWREARWRYIVGNWFIEPDEKLEDGAVDLNGGGRYA